MKTRGTTDAVLPLTKKQKAISNIIMGVLLIAAGIVIVLAGAGVLPVSAGKVAAPALLFAFGIAIAISAVIAKNALSMWLAGVLLACGLTSLLDVITSADYANLFPIYIAAPGIGCVFALIFAEIKFPLVKCILFFGLLAGIFSLASSGLCGWGLTGGLLAAFCGIAVLLFAVDGYLKKERTENA